MAQMLIKELQMIFLTSNVSICNGNIKDFIEKSNFTLNIMFKLFHASVANIGGLKYCHRFHMSVCRHLVPLKTKTI